MIWPTQVDVQLSGLFIESHEGGWYLIRFIDSSVQSLGKKFD